MCIASVRPGAHAHDIGRAIYKTVIASGFCVVRGLSGHGIGRRIHERPLIPNEYDPRFNNELHEGHVFTIEPIVAMGTSETSRRAMAEPSAPKAIPSPPTTNIPC